LNRNALCGNPIAPIAFRPLYLIYALFKRKARMVNSDHRLDELPGTFVMLQNSPWCQHC
jgi:hypothetical protein